MERRVFPISRWFPLPCTPPTSTLQPGPRCCMWNGCRLAACHRAPHRLTNNNEATEAEIDRVTDAHRQAGAAHALFIYLRRHTGEFEIVRPS